MLGHLSHCLLLQSRSTVAVAGHCIRRFRGRSWTRLITTADWAATESQRRVSLAGGQAFGQTDSRLGKAEGLRGLPGRGQSGGTGSCRGGWPSRWILARSRTRGRGSGASATPQRRRRSLNTRGLGKPRPSKVRRFSGRRPWPEGCWHRLFGTDAGFSEYRVPGCRRKHLCGIPCRRMNGLADPWTHGRCPMGWRVCRIGPGASATPQRRGRSLNIRGLGWRVCRIGLVGDKRALASADGKEGEGSRGGQKRMDQPSYRVNGWNASVSYSFRCRLGPRTYESTASAASCPEACPHARTR